MKKAEKTKQFIIEKSAPVFNVKGIAATAMSDVMEATKLAKGSLYVHFENKEELSACVVDYCLKTLADKAALSTNIQQTARAKLFAFIDFFSNPLDSPIFGGCPMINFGMEADDTNPVIRKKVNRMIESVQENITAMIEEGKSAGEFETEWDSEEFAVKTFAMLEGGIMISKVSGNKDKMKVIARILKNEIEAQVL
ncbi:TetR/AcrR family transcriptional regulator [Dyadobacter psychrotolerans]|uniref:TetR/AcrR family transcriptional regulator n=1 Tax=Dyadobacter psychrotolerans TaxID=2541721 RepID=A0A4R5DFH6_9BACT|nr:TetR/AcrR family transcriptional regulator [Dyadobacter psychrotolerans]TDE10514.1 TetR/AcrR family transcriptional regulator [Dyadobacter psychrotolerans]